MKQIMEWYPAWDLAERILGELIPYCRRIQIAGSLRRMKPFVGDIEIVAEPIFKSDMFGMVTDNHCLNDYDYSKIGELKKNGNKFKQIILNEGIGLDLFIVTPPAQYGVILIIRTGSAEFSHRFVMKKNQGGMLHSWQTVRDGVLWSNEIAMITPEETDVFAAVDVRYIEPQDREVAK